MAQRNKAEAYHRRDSWILQQCAHSSALTVSHSAVATWSEHTKRCKYPWELWSITMKVHITKNMHHVKQLCSNQKQLSQLHGFHSTGAGQAHLFFPVFLLHQGTNRLKINLGLSGTTHPPTPQSGASTKHEVDGSRRPTLDPLGPPSWSLSFSPHTKTWVWMSLLLIKCDFFFSVLIRLL